MKSDSPSTLSPQPSALPDRLRSYITAHPPIDGKPFSNADAAREFGYSASMVSKFLSGKLEGDTTRFQNVIEDILKSAAARQQENLTLFETNVSRTVNATLERIRSNNSVGVISGPAGVGKTCGIILYLQVYPSAIFITAARWQRDATALAGLLFAAVETSGYDNRTPRMDFVARKLKDSNRLLIVDNAHRLTIGALELLFDFHDQTGVGIALIGNPAVLDNIRKNDQQYSRCAIKKEITLEKPAKVAAEMLRVSFPDASDDLRDLSEQVVSNRGHLRALKHQIRLAKQIGEEVSTDAVTAFRSAHTQLIRDYQLD